MIRTTVISLALAIAATAAIAIAHANGPAHFNKNIFAVDKPLIFEQCAVEDCSDTPNS